MLVPLLARAAGRRRDREGVAVCLAAAVLPLAAWASHNAVRYDDLARRAREQGLGAVLPGRAATSTRRTATRRAGSRTPSSARSCTLPPYASRGVDVQTYFHGAGNLEVIRMIALSDRVFGWDSDYDVLFDASLEAIRADPWRYVEGVARDVLGLPLAALRARAAGAARADPGPALPSSTVDGKPFPAPITVSPLVEAVRYGSSGARPTTSSGASSRDPEAALGDPGEARRYDELIDTVRDWNAQLPTRDSNAWLAIEGRHRERPLAATRSSGSPSRRSRSPSDGRGAPPRSSC